MSACSPILSSNSRETRPARSSEDTCTVASRLPELQGRYIVGDFIQGRIWAVTLDEGTLSGTKTFLTSFSPGNLVTFAQDNDGEVFFTDIYSSGSIYRLERVGDPQPDAPALLSATGAFSNMTSATPAPFWVPYALNQPFWSDGASKFRFIALPNDGTRNTPDEQIGFSATGDWTFPIGTVLMKHFELPLDEADPSITTRLETRFMVLGDDDDWYGLTYRWRVESVGSRSPRRPKTPATTPSTSRTAGRGRRPGTSRRASSASAVTDRALGGRSA